MKRRVISFDIPLEQGPELLRAARRQGLHELGDLLEAELVAAALIPPDYVQPVKLRLDEVHDREEMSFYTLGPKLNGRIFGPHIVDVKVKLLTTGDSALRTLHQHVGRAFTPVFERPRR